MSVVDYMGGSNLLVYAALCLIECSRFGLYENELRHLLADKNNLTPPSPYDEKGW